MWYIAIFVRVGKLLEEASLFVLTGLSYSSELRKTTKFVLRSEIALSIQMLGCTIQKVFALMQRWHNNTPRIITSWRSSIWAVERLIELGWCPSIVSHLTHWFSGGHYYLSLMDPTRAQDHKHCAAAKYRHEELQPADYPLAVNHIEKD